MRPSEFTIIGASAGSGKTFTITKAYLKILLSDPNNDAFRQILAITFTNKAVGEMKERIISTLKEFASTAILDSQHTMLTSIVEESNLSVDYIHKRSKTLLVHILHNYGGFEISTIDSFVHRIIRTFARDLNLPSNFEVELDQDDMLSRSVDLLISQADAEQDFTAVLVDFALDKSDEDKSFDVAYDLRKIAKLLVNENDEPHLLRLSHKNLNDFSRWKVALNNELQALKTSIASSALTLIKQLANKDVKPSDFFRGFDSYLVKLSQGKSVDFEAGWHGKMNGDLQLYPNKLEDAKKQAIEDLKADILTFYNETKVLITDMWFKSALYKNLTPLSILKSLQESLKTMKNEENKVLISEFNNLLKNEIKEQPTPYIFERLGEKFKHYFIDEFQDTSVMQWQNLIPLFENSLAGPNASASIVGDAKQAIYRWRGGESSQFTSLIEGSSQPFRSPSHRINLENNYRSARTIVEFNNGFFNYISDLVFSNEAHKRVYRDVGQNAISKAAGYIDFQFYNTSKGDDTDGIYGNAVHAIITDCLNRGYQYSDLCILVRKHKHGVALAQHLGLSNIPITSSEALLIKNSPKVKLLLKLLELQINPENELTKATLLYDVANFLKIASKHSFIQKHHKNPLDKVLKDVFTDDKLNWLKNKDTLPLYDLVEFYIELFNFNKQSDAFIQFFLDLVLEQALKREADINSFLEYFFQNEDKLSISAPEHRNAVNIMTIHKSKGLEFPIVIFPYAEVAIDEDHDSHLWLPVAADKNSHFDEAMIGVNRKMEYYNETSAKLYNEHQSNLKLDHINLLYVTLTRPVNELYIICKKDIKKTGVNLKSFAGLFISYLQQLGKWNALDLHYSLGAKTTCYNASKKNATETLNFLSNAQAKRNFNILTNSGLIWNSQQAESIEKGNLIHQLLSYIKTSEDISFALNAVASEGLIRLDDSSLFNSLLNTLISHPTLKPFFSGNYQIYNETDLIGPDNSILRPDRLCIKEDEAVIIDYKTGSILESHKTQVRTYINMVSAMGYNKVMGFLVYTNDSLQVIEV